MSESPPTGTKVEPKVESEAANGKRSPPDADSADDAPLAKKQAVASSDSDDDAPLAKKQAETTKPASSDSDDAAPLGKKQADTAKPASSDSDDDAPLGKKQGETTKPDSSDSDDDAPLGKKQTGTTKPDSSDSDDDAPLAKKQADSDDDVPLGKKSTASVSVKKEKVDIKREKPPAPSAKKTVHSDESDDDKPLSASIKKPAPAAAPKKKAESDSDDDKPLRKPGSAVKKEPVKKEKEIKRKPTPTYSSSEDEPESSGESDSDGVKRKKKSSRSSSRPSTVSKSAASPKKGKGGGGGGGGAGSAYRHTSLKDWLIERYLVRWWYVQDWPPEERQVEDVPDGFAEMAHYPYIYFNETTGQVLNKRDPQNPAPCKQALKKKSIEELRAVVGAAIDAQMGVLEEMEPDNTRLQDELKEEKRLIVGSTDKKWGIPEKKKKSD